MAGSHRRKRMDKQQREMIWSRLENALKKSWSAEKDDDGKYYVEIPAAYNEDNEFLLQDAYDQRYESDAVERLLEQIYEAYFDAICFYENELLREAHFGVDSVFYEEASDILRDNICFSPDFGHFLDEPVKVNLMLATTEEVNGDFVDIMTNKENPDNGLKWLIEQQGYTFSDLKKTMADYNQAFYEGASLDEQIEIFNKQHSKLLTSICQEIDYQSYSMSCLTVLAKMPLRDVVEIFRKDDSGNSVPKNIVMPKDTMLGLFNPWLGAGSVLEIELEKDLVIPGSMIFDYQIEGAKANGYTVDEVYGLVGNAWTEPKDLEKTDRNDVAIERE